MFDHYAAHPLCSSGVPRHPHVEVEARRPLQRRHHVGGRLAYGSYPARGARESTGTESSLHVCTAPPTKSKLLLSQLFTNMSPYVYSDHATGATERGVGVHSIELRHLPCAFVYRQPPHSPHATPTSPPSHSLTHPPSAPPRPAPF